MNILLADDDAISREILRRIILSEPGCTVTMVGDGEQAWTLLRDPERHYDLLILDIVMPEMDGFELLQRIRQQPRTESLPVLLCSASSDRATVQRAGVFGVSHYIVKPFARALVIEKLRIVRTEVAQRAMLDSRLEVTNRLGLDETSLKDFLDKMVIEMEDWREAVLHASLNGNLEATGVRATALKGGCLNLGLRSLGNLLAEFEVMLSPERASQRGRPFPPPAAELQESLKTFTAEVKKVQAFLRPPAPPAAS